MFTASTTGTSSYIVTCLYYCYQTIHNLNCLCMVQVQTYFRTDTEYQKKAAFCVRLDRVPNMSESLKERIKRYVSTNKDMGINNRGRQFVSLETVACGRVGWIY